MIELNDPKSSKGVFGLPRGSTNESNRCFESCSNKREIRRLPTRMRCDAMRCSKSTYFCPEANIGEKSNCFAETIERQDIADGVVKDWFQTFEHKLETKPFIRHHFSNRNKKGNRLTQMNRALSEVLISSL